MKPIVVLLALAALCAAGQESKQPPPAAKKAPAKAPVKAPAKAAPKQPVAANKAAAKSTGTVDPNSIPPGAKEIEPGLYRVIDASGKSWLYTRTPFGYMKSPEAKEFVRPDAVPTDWTVADAGDTVTFTRPYPFGGSKTWTVKKSQLNETEEAVWKKSQGLDKK